MPASERLVQVADDYQDDELSDVASEDEETTEEEGGEDDIKSCLQPPAATFETLVSKQCGKKEGAAAKHASREGVESKASAPCLVPPSLLEALAAVAVKAGSMPGTETDPASVPAHAVAAGSTARPPTRSPFQPEPVLSRDQPFSESSWKQSNVTSFPKRGHFNFNLCGVKCDMVQLHAAVLASGGVDEVAEAESWRQVATGLGISDSDKTAAVKTRE